MKNKITPETHQNIIAFTLSGIMIASVCFAFMKWESILKFLSTVWVAMAPFVWGFCLAFILSPLRRLCEEKWLSRLNISKSVSRPIAVGFSLVVMIVAIVVFFSVLIPQLVSSFETLAASMDGYISTLETFMNDVGRPTEEETFVYTLYETLKSNIVELVGGTGPIVSKFLNYSVSLVKGIFSFLVGMIIAVYLLLDQERWIRQFKRVMYAFLAPEVAEEVFRIFNLTGNMLDNFIFGKALDSLIIGIACGICCGLMKIPYTPLIAFIIGLTNMIPVFGPFIGAIPCAFILLIISPAKALEFIIFILILQQVDGNILGPYILGDSMGLPPLWVMFAIVVGGSLWGILGMFLGVPLFSVIYILIKEIVMKRLKERRIRID